MVSLRGLACCGGILFQTSGTRAFRRILPKKQGGLIQVSKNIGLKAKRVFPAVAQLLESVNDFF
jgi:hypothetical protein